MLATALLCALRGRGFDLRLDRPAPEGPGRLLVRPGSRLTDQDRVELRANKPALLTLLAAEASAPLILWEPDVMLALEIFPGAQVIAHHAPAVWPSPGGWIPSSCRVRPAPAPPGTAPAPGGRAARVTRS
jgi:hypothetical protein